MDKEDQVIDLFKEMATAISQQYSFEIAVMKLLNDAKPGFDELKEELVKLDKTLADKGAWLIEQCRKKQGFDAERLTAELKSIIADAIGRFVKTL